MKMKIRWVMLVAAALIAAVHMRGQRQVVSVTEQLQRQAADLLFKQNTELARYKTQRKELNHYKALLATMTQRQKSLEDGLHASKQAAVASKEACAGASVVVQRRKLLVSKLTAALTSVQRPPSCRCARYLDLPLRGDGFANIMHVVGHALTMGLFSRRVVVISGEFRYSPCPDKDWGCVFYALSSCTAEDIDPEGRPGDCPKEKNHSLAYDSLHSLESPYWPQPPKGEKRPEQLPDADPKPHIWPTLFGNDPVTEMGAYQDVSDLSKRLWMTGALDTRFMEFGGGNFWLRAHIQAYMWRLAADRTVALRKNRDFRHLAKIRRAGERYVAFHIRLSDNIGTLASDWAFDARKMFSLERMMGIAQRIRDQDPRLRSVYVATDNKKIADAILKGDAAGAEHNMLSKWRQHGWRFLTQTGESVQRTDTKQWTWFMDNAGTQADGFIADIEALYRADYIVGSMTSNVFRLAAELHYANSWSTAEGVCRFANQTIFTVDVPWMMDL